MFCIYILSFQGPNASLVFPMQGVSLHWFEALFGQARTGDVGGAFARSLPLALIILAVTVLFSVAAGLAFRARFFGNSVIFYTAIGSLVVPGLVLGGRYHVAAPAPRLERPLVLLGARRASDLDAALRAADHVCRAEPFRPAR